MPNILDEYLVKLGTTVDQTGFARFHQALREASGVVDANMANIAKSMFKAQTEIVAGFASIGVAAVGLVDKVAMADQEYRLFALHMYMSKDAARGLKVAMDALGQPLENLWWDKELAARTHQLIMDQRAMAPGGDFEDQMRKVRDIRFEFTRMEVELQYLGMHVVQDFLKALGMGPDDLLTKLRKFNDWVTTHLPEISATIVRDFLPIWRDIKDVMGAALLTAEDFATLFTNIIGLLSGNSNLEGATFNFHKFAGALETVAHWMAVLFEILSKLTGLVLGTIGGSVGGGLIGSIVGGVAGIPAGPVGIAAGILGGGATGTAIGGGAGAAVGGAFDLYRHFRPSSVLGASSSAANASAGDINAVVAAIIGQESSGNSHALSSKGAMGLMQLMPGTAKDLGVTDPYDPTQNRAAGTAYIKQLLAKYGDLPTALAAYNWGPGHMDKFLSGKIGAMPSETTDYVSRVMGRMGSSGDVQVGSVTIHIYKPGATGADAADQFTSRLRDIQQKRVQRNLAEFQDLSPSY